MEEETKPVESDQKSEETKSKEAVIETVSLADFLAHKKASGAREIKLKSQLADYDSQLKRLNAELKVAKLNGSEDETEEIKSVKSYLLDEKGKLEERITALEKRETEFSAKEKTVRLREIGTEYALTKKELESLEDEEDIEKAALKLYNKKLAKQVEDLKKGGGGGSFYENANVGNLRKMPKDMTDKEFEEYEKRLKAVKK